MNFIIGSGLIGMIAKSILGDSWELVTQKRSRYYSFNPVLADNNIIVSPETEGFVKSLFPMATPILRSRCASLGGQLFNECDESLAESYIRKVYGDRLALPLKTKFFVYDVTAKQLHDRLQETHRNEIANSRSEVLKLDLDNHILTVKVGNEIKSVEFDRVISTVPLTALMDWAGIEHNFEAKTVCYYHIRTTKIDLEGADEALVCDETIPFFKCIKLGDTDYMFWTFDGIDSPQELFGSILGYDFEIVEVFRINDAIPIGSPPNLSWMSEHGVHCVGSNSQWDDMIGISSCIKRISQEPKSRLHHGHS